MENMAKHYIHEIPEGYEARIEGNKVIIELRESEDERIRKEIINFLRSPFVNENITDEKVAPWIAWLEKQKYDRMKPIYDARESFESALEKAWKDYNDSGARTVDGCEDDYVECAHAKGFREGYLFGIEKRKEHQNNSDAPNESSWAGIISSSDKDKNLDEIAQDYVDGVKAYNPEPTWDLIQTAVCYGYHYREQKEQKPQGVYVDCAEHPEWYGMPPKEQKPNIEICPHSIKSKSYKENGYPIENCDYGLEIAENILERTLGKIEGYQSDDGIREHQTAIEAVKKAKEQKPVEWSEEDKEKLKAICTYLRDYSRLAKLGDKLRFNEYCDFLESLRPSWKPSEEQMKALFDTTNPYFLAGDRTREILKSLYEDLIKLKGGVAPMREIDE